MTTKLFGTDGIRGEANKWPITPEIAMRITIINICDKSN